MASGEMSSRATYLKTSGDITLITVDMTLGEMTFGRLDRLPSVLIKSLLSAFNKKTQCSCRVMKTISNDFQKHFLVIFAGISLKLEKLEPTFSSFYPCAFMSSVATDDRKQFQYLNIALNNNTGPLFLEFN